MTKFARLIFPIVTCVILSALPGWAVDHSPKHSSSLELQSSDERLVEAFHWAKRQALDYVFDGDPVGPWYEASLPGRSAFCMRDVSHQTAGAEALGLSAYNLNMLHRFAENTSPSRDWCSYWEIDSMNRPASADYKSDAEFWYNLPANFDVLDACYRMYLWTGNKAYIEDPAFLNFYKHTVTDYVSRWNLSPDRIMFRKNLVQGPPYFRGDPSYEESRADIVLGADLLAAQYAGYRAYAAMEAIRGNKDTAAMYLGEASDVKSLVNIKWWSPTSGTFYGFMDKDRQLHGSADADLLYWNVVEDGPKTQWSVHALVEKMRTEPDKEVEPESHYAEILYRYGDSAMAYREVLDLSRPGRERQEYPEVSYSVVGAIVNGLMGINVVPAVSTEEVLRDGQFSTVIETMPNLTAQTTWAQIKNLPVAGGIISVRHDGATKTALTNQGKSQLMWKASFPGNFATLLVNGKPVRSQSTTVHLIKISSVTLPVNGGDSITVEAPK